MSVAAAAVSRQAMAPRVLNLIQACQSRVRILVQGPGAAGARLAGRRRGHEHSCHDQKGCHLMPASTNP